MATKARLHWVWRGIIAVSLGVGLFCVQLLVTMATVVPARAPERAVMAALGRVMEWSERSTREITGIGLVYMPISVVACLVVYMLLGRWGDRFGESRCRQCNRVLRGLEEPRCPNCGEPI